MDRYIAIVLTVLTCSTALADKTVHATTQQGILVGLENETSQYFLGIPYAKQPVGELRWRSPQPPESWDGERTAFEFGPACPQPDDRFSRTKPGPRDEACLYLNIWAPANRYERAALPVMV